MILAMDFRAVTTHDSGNARGEQQKRECSYGMTDVTEQIITPDRAKPKVALGDHLNNVTLRVVTQHSGNYGCPTGKV
jgi:hypothetical protein